MTGSRAIFNPGLSLDKIKPPGRESSSLGLVNLHPMIRLRNVTLHRGGRSLFENTDLTVYPDHKVGVTGANGSGKSSLFALLLGKLHHETGAVELPRHWTVASVAQEIPATAGPAIDYVMGGDAELRLIEAELVAAAKADDGARLANLHVRYEAIDGYTARNRAAQLLHGLGFSAEEYARPVDAFSGGWRMRLNLAQALMCRSNLLLLDEPTNHLDLDAVLWLERWLRGYSGTLLLISHDRDFLNNAVNHIAHIEQRGITLYTGSYTQFERQRAERMAHQTKAAQKQHQEIAHMRAFVARFRAKATKARQAQSRLKALERMELIAAVHADSPFHFSFRDPGRCANPLLQLENVQVGYDGPPVLDALSLTLAPGDRLGLLGRNGAGKSTLIKLLTGALAPQAGERQEANGLRIGYFAQHQLEQLDPESDALTHLQRLAAQSPEQRLRDFLGSLGFSGDDVLRPAGSFSGGEKARLALALLVWQRPHLLLLDEPTNHLDLRMRDALTLALQDFSGALVLVSHDRHLLRTTTDRLILVAEGRVREFAGDLDDYRDWLLKGEVAANPSQNQPSSTHSAAGRKEKRRNEAQLRARHRPLVDQLQRLETEMEGLQKQQQDLETALADPAIYEASQKTRLQASLLRQAEIRARLDQAEEEWLAVNEALEAMPDTPE